MNVLSTIEMVPDYAPVRKPPNLFSSIAMDIFSGNSIMDFGAIPNRDQNQERVDNVEQGERRFEIKREIVHVILSFRKVAQH